MEKNKKILKQKCATIKLVLTDVDGVLTDGGMYYDKHGDTMKKFHTRDGMGVTLLQKHNIQTIVVTKEKTEIVKKWCKKMKITYLYDGIVDKKKILKKVCKKFNLTPNKIAFIGDDVNDLELLKSVGLSATPKDGIFDAKKICDYTCNLQGGRGAFRELADLILQCK